jgi:hypothetical protein
MTVRLLRLAPTRHRARLNRRGSYTEWAHVVADVDGYSVRCQANRGWDCTCDDPDCGHLDAVAELIHPDMLAELEPEENQ